MKNMRKIYKYIVDTGVLIIFLLALYLLNPFNTGYLIGYLIIPSIIIQSSFIKENLDLDFVLLFLFSFLYALFYSFNADSSQGKQFIFIYASFPPTFYLTGKYLVRNKISANTIFLVLFFVGSIFSISAVISVFINFQVGGFVQFERTIPMFWNGELVSATGMAGFLTLNMCIPGLLIANQGKRGLLFNSSAILLFLISLICVLRLGSRTQLGVFLITSIFAVFYIIPKQAIKKNIVLAGIFLVVILYISRNVSFDLDAAWLTTFASRLEGGTEEMASGGGRSQRWMKSLEYLVSHPLGWDKRDFGYSHNLWFDVLRVGGIIPFMLLLVFSIRSFFQTKRTFALNKSNIAFNAQILIYSIAFFLVFMVEPIIEGLFSFFIVFCLFQGIINKHYSNLKEY